MANRVEHQRPVQNPALGVNGTIWRHTIGRVSNITRVPINMVASFLQSLKIAGKVIALPVTYSIVGLHSAITKDKNRYIGSMSLRGIALSGIDLTLVLRSIGRCFKRTIIAPDSKDPDFLKGLKGTLSVLAGRGVILSTNRSDKAYSVSEVFKRSLTKSKKS